jgi:hypothetical protein
MADDVKYRTPAPQPLPNDEAFTAGREPDHEPHPPEEEFLENLMFESNTYKMEHYRSAAQALANELGCAVLLHYYALPGFERTNGTMMAALIPADEGKVAPAPPPITRSTRSKSPPAPRDETSQAWR